MAYIPEVWVDGAAGGTPITADRLNHLENGVAAVTTTADTASQPAFAWVYRFVDQAYSSSALTTILWDAEAEDASSFHDNVNTDRLTVPVGKGGLYQFCFALQLSGSGVGSSAVVVGKNGGALLPDITSPVPGALAFSGSAFFRLADGDYITLSIYTNAGTGLAIKGGVSSWTNTASFLQLVRVGS